MTSGMDLTTLAQERSQGYWLLSRLFLQVPDDAHLKELQATLASVDVHGPLAELRREVDVALTVADAAAVDFTRHLVLVSKQSSEDLPYESFVREGTVPGQTTAEVVGYMAEAGFADVADDAPSPDHIGAQLKFMALLCHDEYQAWTENKRDEALRLIAMEQDFLKRHLGDWAPAYCASLETHAEHGYLQAVARLTRNCLLADISLVDDLSSDLGTGCAR
ncbi:hypothetical protein EGT07_24045 [Herbaspirillum sp. HC18]|nr:hypothetical protein EGT07_24045 [Herbaspirillum sp. HC18]